MITSFTSDFYTYLLYKAYKLCKLPMTFSDNTHQALYIRTTPVIIPLAQEMFKIEQ